MSLLDTLPDVLDAELDDVEPGSGVMDTLADVGDVDEAELFGLSPLGADVGTEALLAPASGSADGCADVGASRRSALSRKRRGRDAGGGHENKATLSKSEICRNAAVARWGARQTDASGPAAPTSAAHAAAAEVPACNALVPFREDGLDRSVMSIIERVSPEDAERDEAARKAFRESKHIASYNAIGKQLKVDKKTVRNKMRRMAALIVFGTKHRWWLSLRSIIEQLKATGNDYASILYVLKQRYDEFQTVLRVAAGAEGIPEAWVREKKNTIRAKIMQINTNHAALMRYKGRHFAIEVSFPTLLKPMETTEADCTADVLEDQDCMDSWAEEEFQEGARLAVSDSAASLGLAEFALFQKYEWRTLLRYLCLVHVGHRISELQWQAFP